MKFEFPKNFYWGAVTSAHQVEGNNHNDWSEWEHANSARLAAEAARRHAKAPMRIPDYILKNYPNPLQEENYISGRACDHYNRFREDFDIAKSLGHNAHRFSIEWSRIEPEEGKFNEKEIEHYREVIAALRERGIEPFVTLWHNTNPIWIRDIGGWENRNTVEFFVRYVEKITGVIKGVKFWTTLNEPSVYAGLGYVVGQQPPYVRSLRRANRVLKNMLSAHRSAYGVIHKNTPTAEVGIIHNLIHMIPYRNFPWNYVLVWLLNYLRNTIVLNAIRNTQDFIGLNYYFTDFINFTFGKGRWGRGIELKNPDEWVSDLGWQIYPEGLYRVIKAASEYRKPIYITENGVADSRDIHRERFIKEHLQWIHKAIQDGADVRGYLYWSLLDNFEGNRMDGFWPRFGLVEVDYKTMERRIRQSAYEYATIAKENAIDL